MLVGPGDEPIATVRAWDSASTGIEPPPMPVTVQGNVGDERVEAEYRQGLIAAFDASDRAAGVWFADYARIHWYERAEPLRAAIHWALTNEQCFLVHASAVGDQRGAVILTGRGGAGKSTTTLASIEAGLSFVGDNYVLLSLDEPEPCVYGLYSNAKLWPRTLERLPALAPFVRTFDVAEDEKLVIDVAAYRPDSLATGLPVRAVVVPRVGDRSEARISRCSGAQALLAMAPTTMLQLPQTGSGLDGMGQLLRRVPTYELELGTDLISGPRAISTLLGKLC